ncbi:MAG: DUF4340 domain-containing protein [Alphaproteobacteria bacterium]|nr:DUF4340 domain-containing protein [Alphaproteobacteria bacterium]
MKKQQKKLLLVTFVVIVMTAVSLLLAPKYSEEIEQRGEKIFPEMMALVNNVQKMQINYVDGTRVFEKHDKSWTIPEKENYPANSVHIREMLIDVARLEYFDVGEEAGEDIAENYPELILFDGDDKQVARMFVGDFRKIGQNTDGILINPQGDKSFWLAKGDVHIFPNKLLYWFDQPLLNVPANKIIKVVVGNVKGVRTVIKRHKDKGLVLDNLPKGYDSNPYEIKRLAASITALEFVDVMKVKPEHNIDKSKSPYAKFETDDSLEIEIYAHKIDDELWISVDAKMGEMVTAGRVLDEIINISNKTKGNLYKIPMKRFYNIMTAAKVIKQQ